jgi:hypothetical protein
LQLAQDDVDSVHSDEKQLQRLAKRLEQLFPLRLATLLARCVRAVARKPLSRLCR